VKAEREGATWDKGMYRRWLGTGYFSSETWWELCVEEARGRSSLEMGRNFSTSPYNTFSIHPLQRSAEVRNG